MLPLLFAMFWTQAAEAHPQTLYVYDAYTRQYVPVTRAQLVQPRVVHARTAPLRPPPVLAIGLNTPGFSLTYQMMAPPPAPVRQVVYRRPATTTVVTHRRVVRHR